MLRMLYFCRECIEIMTFKAIHSEHTPELEDWGKNRGSSASQPEVAKRIHSIYQRKYDYARNVPLTMWKISNYLITENVDLWKFCTMMMSSVTFFFFIAKAQLYLINCQKFKHFIKLRCSTGDITPFVTTPNRNNQCFVIEVECLQSDNMPILSHIHEIS